MEECCPGDLFVSFFLVQQRGNGRTGVQCSYAAIFYSIYEQAESTQTQFRGACCTEWPRYLKRTDAHALCVDIIWVPILPYPQKHLKCSTLSNLRTSTIPLGFRSFLFLLCDNQVERTVSFLSAKQNKNLIRFTFFYAPFIRHKTPKNALFAHEQAYITQFLFCQLPKAGLCIKIEPHQRPGEPAEDCESRGEGCTWFL